jgi:DNA-binding PadR family transcriptional regulator
MSDGMSGGNLDLPLVDWLVPFLLLDLRGENSCEHELTLKIAEYDFEGARLGAAYTALRQMEEEGLVVSERDALDGGPWVYAITELGEAYLEFWAKSLTWYREEVDLFFEVYAGGTARVAHR